MAFVDYYKVMGIPKDTPQKDIRSAYKKRTKQLHPDLHPDDPKAKAKFQMLNEANEVLSDPEKRKLYDTYGENWKNAQNMGGHGPFTNGPFTGGNPFENINMDFGNGGGFSEFFESLFGGAVRQQSSRRHRKAEPAVTEAVVKIDVWTAMLGGEIIASTNYGKFKLKVAAGTQPGKKVKLKGKGGKMSNGADKDLIIIFEVTIPESLTERQKSLLEEARKA